MIKIKALKAHPFSADGIKVETLSAGETYEVPEWIAESLKAQGVAEIETPKVGPSEDRSDTPDETKDEAEDQAPEETDTPDETKDEAEDQAPEETDTPDETKKADKKTKKSKRA